MWWARPPIYKRLRGFGGGYPKGIGTNMPSANESKQKGNRTLHTNGAGKGVEAEHTNPQIAQPTVDYEALLRIGGGVIGGVRG